MRRTALALLAAATLALAGCSSSGSDDSPASTPTPSVTPSASTQPLVADQIAACTDAIAAGKDSSAPECADLSPDDYLKALRASNQRGRDALQSALDAATSQP